MNTSPIRLILPLLAAACATGLSGCASTVQSRIAQNPQLYENLSATHKALVTRGKITEGMTRDAVHLAWGRPDSVKTSSSGGRVTETWLYTNFYPEYAGYHGYGWGHFGYPYYGYGYHHGYYCPGPSVYYRSYVAGKVSFSGNRVTQWEVTRP